MTFLRHLALALAAVLLFVAPAAAQTPDDRQFDRVIESLTNLDGPKLSSFFDHIGVTPSPDFYECLCPTDGGFHYHIGPEGSCRRMGPLGGLEFRGFDMPRMKSCAAAFPLEDGRTVLQAIILAARPTCSIGPEAALGSPAGRDPAELMLAVTGDPPAPPSGPLSADKRDRIIKTYIYGMLAEIDYDSCGTFGRWFSDYGPQLRAALCLALGAGSSTNPVSIWGAGSIVASCLLKAVALGTISKDLSIIADLFQRTDEYVKALDTILVAEDWAAVDRMTEEDRRKWFETHAEDLAKRGWAVYGDRVNTADILAPLARRWAYTVVSTKTMSDWDAKYGTAWGNNSGNGSQITMRAYILLRLWQLHKSLGNVR